MSPPRLTVRVDPPPDFWEPVQKGLRAFNESRVGAMPKRQSLAVLAQDEAGEVLGGAVGWLTVGWLYVDMLWVDERHRHTGLGSELLGKLEALAVEHGVRRARLNTASWQARGFYEKNGYTVFAQLDMTLENAPGGTEQVDYFMRKDLAPAPR